MQTSNNNKNKTQIIFILLYEQFLYTYIYIFEGSPKIMKNKIPNKIYLLECHFLKTDLPEELPSFFRV